MPPELAELFGMAGGAPSMEEPMAEPPPEGGGQPIDLLKQMIELGIQAMQQEPEEEDKATISDVVNRLQQYLAKDQAEQDGMMQGKASPRAIRKATVGAGY